MILHHEFIKAAKKYSGKNAIVDKTTDRTVPYHKALIASLILAKKFSKYKEGYLGIMIPNSAGSFLAVLGTVVSGKVPVMINYSTGAANNCEYAQNKIGFKTILTSRALCEKIGCRLVPGMVFLEDIMEHVTGGNKIAAAAKAALPAKVIINSLPKADIEDTVVILFTSGSEKDPKAVQLTHRNIGSNIQDVVQLLSLEPKDVMMSILPLFHVFGQMANFWLPMSTGMTAITYANPLDYKKIPELLRTEKVTMIAATPIFFTGYLKESKSGDFSTVRLAIAGADKVPDSLREGFQKKQNLVLLEGYGATETSPVVSVNTPKDNKPGSIGKVVPSCQVKITDIRSGKALPTGQEGKILVKGENIMKGYFDDIEETSLRIVDGWYDTGDMGMMDAEGFLWHRGRLKRFVKIGGEMVSLVRSETVLEEMLPSGVGCCVVEVPDSVKGARLVAAVTEKVNEKEMIRKMGQKLSPIGIPKTFVVIPEMPKMGSGKIDFRTITDMVRDMLKDKNGNYLSNIE
jgi:acyl-[acyl-carrier-protein]-phospholipid O-acyltransferase/long-chain-fatty-acid--[acyl-carrier-protein] ligase